MSNMEFKFRYSIDIEAYYKANGIDSSKRVTSPYYLDKNNIPEEDGLFDPKIFGELGTDERMGTHGYIQLNQKVIHPAVYRVLLKKFRAFNDFIIMKKILILDEKNILRILPASEESKYAKNKVLKTYDDLYNVWDKINWNINTVSITSRTQNELLTQYKTQKDRVFIDKWIVSPAGSRDFKDKNSTETSKTSRDLVSIPEINDLYVSVIRYSNVLENNIDGYDEMTIAKLQTSIYNIYLYYVERLPKKSGIIQKSYNAKASSSVIRGIIVNQIVGNNTTGKKAFDGIGSMGVPLSMYVIGNREQFLHTFIEILNLTERTVTVNGNTYVTDMDKFNNEITDVKKLSKLIEYYYISKKFRVREFKIGDQYITIPLLEWVLKRKVTFTDVFWLVAEAITSDLYNSWCSFIRYPVLDFKATHFANPKILTISDTISIRKRVEEFYFAAHSQPDGISESLVETYREAFAKINYDNYPNLNIDDYGANKWYDGLMLHNTNTKDMGADFDGDSITLRFIQSQEAKANARKFNGSVVNYISSGGSSSRLVDANIAEGIVWALN